MGRLSSREGPEKRGGGGGRGRLFFSVLIPLSRTESLVTDILRTVHKTFFSIEKVNASRHRALFQKSSDTISNNFSPGWDAPVS